MSQPSSEDTEASPSIEVRSSDDDPTTPAAIAGDDDISTPVEVLNAIFEEIPDNDQAKLMQDHSVKSIYDFLKLKDSFSQRSIDGVRPEVQMFLYHICQYIDSLDNIFSDFSWVGFQNFCGFKDTSGVTLEEDLTTTARNTSENREDEDPEGLNLTAEERKRMEDQMAENPLNITIRSFSPQSLQFEFETTNKKKEIDEATDKTEVVFNGDVYYKGKCYTFQQDSGAKVTVGIRKFTKNEKKAICALVVPFHDTVMGPQQPEQPPDGVKATYDEEDKEGVPDYVQVYQPDGQEPIIPLSRLIPTMTPSEIPKLIYEPQRTGEPPHNFGFVYEHDGTNRCALREGDKTFMDLFAGSGGYHQGVMQAGGFKGVAAVEYWDKACETFSHNHPETPVYEMKVEDFLDENGPSPVEFRMKHGKVLAVLCSPPCQSFSGSNRNVDHNGEKDLYRKSLSLKFFDAMQVSGALVGVFENVEGMWRRPNIYFLKKIVLDHIKAGYQVRVRLHKAHVFGDPQARPRLLIYVAKSFVEMPNVIQTHGPGKLTVVTVGNAFKTLEYAVKQHGSLPNMERSQMTNPDRAEDILQVDKPAGTIRCGGRAWHPTEDRCISVRECATLQSYPFDYEFLGSITDQYKQVGNAVPGMMARAVGIAIANSLRYVYQEELDEEISTQSDHQDVEVVSESADSNSSFEMIEPEKEKGTAHECPPADAAMSDGSGETDSDKEEGNNALECPPADAAMLDGPAETEPDTEEGSKTPESLPADARMTEV